MTHPRSHYSASVRQRAAKLSTPRKVRRKGISIEHQQQAALMLRLSTNLRKLYESTAAVPNGGTRNKLEARKLKTEGVKAGYPDLLIDKPRGPYHGARIEMKKPEAYRSDVSDEQLEWGARLEADGYFWAVALGADQEMILIHAYWRLGAFDLATPKLTRSTLLAEFPRRYRAVGPFKPRGKKA